MPSVDERLTELEKDIGVQASITEGIEEKFSELEASINQTQKSFGECDNIATERFMKIESRLDAIEAMSSEEWDYKTLETKLEILDGWLFNVCEYLEYYPMPVNGKEAIVDRLSLINSKIMDLEKSELEASIHNLGEDVAVNLSRIEEISKEHKDCFFNLGKKKVDLQWYLNADKERETMKSVLQKLFKKREEYHDDSIHQDFYTGLLKKLDSKGTADGNRLGSASDQSKSRQQGRDLPPTMKEQSEVGDHSELTTLLDEFIDGLNKLMDELKRRYTESKKESGEWDIGHSRALEIIMDKLNPQIEKWTQKWEGLEK